MWCLGTSEEHGWKEVTKAKGKKESIHTFLSPGWRWDWGALSTQQCIVRGRGSMPPLCAYNIVVILQMDFVLLLRSINDWTHESQCGPEPVNHRPRGKKASLNRTSLSLRAQGMSLTKCKKRPTKRKTFRHNFSILELDIRIERYLTLFTKDSIYC